MFLSRNIISLGNVPRARYFILLKRMGFSPTQRQLIEIKLPILQDKKHKIHEAVTDYVRKVNSLVKALEASPEINDNMFLQISSNIEKAVLYLQQKTEEINSSQSNFADGSINYSSETLDVMQEKALKEINCSETSSLSGSSVLGTAGPQLQTLTYQANRRSFINSTKRQRGFLSTAELPARSAKETEMLNATQEDDDDWISRWLEEENCSTLSSRSASSLLHTEEDERETARTVKKRRMLKVYKTKINNQQSEQKHMTVTVGNVELREVEVCDKICDGQWESERLKKRDCTKNPGHEGFMDISDFKLEHLPERYHDNRVVDYIKAEADLVVKVMVKYVSPARPDGYFLADKRDQHINNFGSGWVWSVNRNPTEQKNDHCPCSICRASATPQNHWALFTVITANTVVYDSEEASNTTCELFYDSEEVRGQGLILEGVQVSNSSMKADYCKMECVTHDQELIKKLEAMLARKYNLLRELIRKYRGAKLDDNAVFVVSHPHGGKKQISLGKVTHIQRDKTNKIYYSAHTCPGSSGGFVWLPGQDTLKSYILYFRTHSGGSQEGNNNFSMY